MKKIGAIKVLSSADRRVMTVSSRPAPFVSERAHRKIRKSENAKAELARRASSIRIG